MLKFIKAVLVGIGALVVLTVAAVFAQGAIEGYQDASKEKQATPAEAPAPQAIEIVFECHRLATNPDQMDADFEGVPDSELDGLKAVVACEQAVAAKPSDGRLHFQLARGYANLNRRDEALTHLRKSVDFGSPQGQFGMYIWSQLEPPVVQLSDAQKLSLLMAASQSGHVEASRSLAEFYYLGQYVEKSIPKAAAILQDLAEKGHLKSMAEYGSMIARGLVPGKNINDALVWTEKGAKAGDVMAMANLADMLFTTNSNDPKAIEWAEKAATQGHTESRRFLINYYDSRQNLGKVRYWLNIMVKAGDAVAMLQLGNLLIRSNTNEAIQHYQSAFDLGNIQAGWQMVGYHRSRNDQSNQEKWLEAIFDKGDAQSNAMVATVYASSGMYDKAHKFFSTIAQSKDPAALAAAFKAVSAMRQGQYWLELERFSKLYLQYGGNEAPAVIAEGLMSLLSNEGVYYDKFETIFDFQAAAPSTYAPALEGAYNLLARIINNGHSVPADLKTKFGKSQGQYQRNIKNALTVHNNGLKAFRDYKARSAVWKQGYSRACGGVPGLPSINTKRVNTAALNTTLDSWRSCLDKQKAAAHKFIASNSTGGRDSRLIIFAFKQTAMGFVLIDHGPTARQNYQAYIKSLDDARASLEVAIRRYNSARAG